MIKKGFSHEKTTYFEETYGAKTDHLAQMTLGRIGLGPSSSQGSGSDFAGVDVGLVDLLHQVIELGDDVLHLGTHGLDGQQQSITPHIGPNGFKSFHESFGADVGKGPHEHIDTAAPRPVTGELDSGQLGVMHLIAYKDVAAGIKPRRLVFVGPRVADIGRPPQLGIKLGETQAHVGRGRGADEAGA